MKSAGESTHHSTASRFLPPAPIESILAVYQRDIMKGKLIAVEGLDGSGKSTQIYLVKRWLELSGIKVFFTEWNSSVVIKKATKKGKKGTY